jgi:hypothetical protein
VGLTRQLGATKPEQIVENLKALDVYKKITPEIVSRIEEILDNKPGLLVSVAAAALGRADGCRTATVAAVTMAP